MRLIPQKMSMLVGGLLGFAVAFMANLALNNGPMRALMDGSIGCLVGALVVRVVVHAINSSIAEAMTRPPETPAKDDAQKDSV